MPNVITHQDGRCKCYLFTTPKAALAGADGAVLALAGHQHSDAVEEVDLGQRRLTQVRTALLASNKDHWRRLRLFEDRIEISATGQPEQVIKTIPAQAARPTVAGHALPLWTEGTRDIHRISAGKGGAVFHVLPDGARMLVDPGATGRQGPRVTEQCPDSSRTPGEWGNAIMRNYRPFVEWQSRNRGLKVERFRPGRKDQSVPVREARRCPEFEIRSVAPNGEVWTGVGTTTRQHFPRLKDLKVTAVYGPCPSM